MVCAGLERHGFHVQWHEDRAGLGIPDVSYGFGGINGWIEFKWLRTEFEPMQPRWLAHRARTGGHTFVLTGYRESIELIEWGSMSVVTIERYLMSEWLPVLLPLLTVNTPYGGEVVPLVLHDQVMNRIPRPILTHLGSSEIEALRDRMFPFPANLAECLQGPETSSSAS